MGLAGLVAAVVPDVELDRQVVLARDGQLLAEARELDVAGHVAGVVEADLAHAHAARRREQLLHARATGGIELRGAVGVHAGNNAQAKREVWRGRSTAGSPGEQGVARKLGRHEARLGVGAHERAGAALDVVDEGEQLAGRARGHRRLVVLVGVGARAGHAVGERVEWHYEQAHARKRRTRDGHGRVVPPERREVTMRVRQRRQRLRPLERLPLAVVEQLAIRKRQVRNLGGVGRLLRPPRR